MPDGKWDLCLLSTACQPSLKNSLARMKTADMLLIALSISSSALFEPVNAFPPHTGNALDLLAQHAERTAQAAPGFYPAVAPTGPIVQGIDQHHADILVSIDVPDDFFAQLPAFQNEAMAQAGGAQLVEKAHQVPRQRGWGHEDVHILVNALADLQGRVETGFVRPVSCKREQESRLSVGETTHADR
jgi:hypothetical protein